MSVLIARLNKLERSLPEPAKRGRVFRVIAGPQDEEAAKRLIEAEGYDPDHGDLAFTASSWNLPVSHRTRSRLTF